MAKESTLPLRNQKLSSIGSNAPHPDEQPMSRSFRNPLSANIAPKNSSVRILLTYPNRLLRESLAAALRNHDGFDVNTIAPEQALGLLVDSAKLLNPDVILLGGFDSAIAISMTRTLAAICLNARIVIMGIGETEDDVIRCIEAGAWGCILKDSDFEQLVGMINAVSRGESFVSPRLTAALCRRLAVLSRLAQPFVVEGRQPLSTREREIVRLIVAGLQNKEIAVRLYIETQTVKNHVHNILEKLGLSSRHEVARQAQLNGLI